MKDLNVPKDKGVTILALTITIVLNAGAWS